MIVTVKMEYLALRKNGIYAYKRRVPVDVQLAYGGDFFTASLKTRDKELALVRYAEPHAKVEAKIAALRKKSPNKIRYEKTKAELVEAGFMASGDGSYVPATFEENEKRALAQARHLHDVAKAMSKEALNGQSRNSGGELERTVEAHFKGIEESKITLRAALKDYLKANEHRDTYGRLKLDAERVVEFLAAIMEKADPELQNIERSNALDF